MSVPHAVRLIGVDWSAEESKRGVAAVDLVDGAAALVELVGCGKRRNASSVIRAALTDTIRGAAVSRPIPLLWSSEELRDVGVIEVYPAATKLALRERSPFVALRLRGVGCANRHVEDALWCAVAALHFVRGECHLPTEVVRSRREGWIWFIRADP